jgi:hypothetical protein
MCGHGNFALFLQLDFQLENVNIVYVRYMAQNYFKHINRCLDFNIIPLFTQQR